MLDINGPIQEVAIVDLSGGVSDYLEESRLTLDTFDELGSSWNAEVQNVTLRQWKASA